MSLLDAYSPYVGLVTALDELLPSPDDARQFHVVAAAAAPSAGSLDRGALPRNPGSGYGVDRRRALEAALGEAVERYSATQVPEARLVSATARELGPAAVSPASFSLFAPEQHALPDFPFTPFTDETRIRWVRGLRLADGAEAWLPAQLVYLTLPHGEPQIGYSTSNGLAAAVDGDTALLGALLELVERDSFMIAWKARLSFPRLAWRRSPELLAHYTLYLAPAHARLTAVDLSRVHGVPTVAAIVRGRPGALAVGASAAPTVEQAWRTAVTEAYAVRKAARETVVARPERRFATDFGDVTDFHDHVEVYAYDAHAPRADFLDASPEETDPRDVEPLAGATAREQIRSLVSRLGARGVDAYAVDVTSADVRDLGIRVVRAIAPPLLPLDVRHDARYLGGTRLYTAPVELGFAAEPLSLAQLNPDPHPFP